MASRNDRSDPTGEPRTPLPQVVSTRSGLRVRLPRRGAFSIVLAGLEEVLAAGPDLHGQAVTIDAAGRRLGPAQLRSLEVIVLERGGAALLQVVQGRSAAPAKSSEPDAGAEGRRAVRRAWHEPAAAASAPAGAPADAANLSAEAIPTLLLRRTLRSGQRVRYHGNVVVLGDVNPGAEIVAAGDIVVMGTLRGVAHAGATGSTESIVAAFRLQPTQIRVGAVIGRAPDGQAARPDVPELARLRDGVLVIERYVPASGEGA